MLRSIGTGGKRCPRLVVGEATRIAFVLPHVVCFVLGGRVPSEALLTLLLFPIAGQPRVSCTRVRVARTTLRFAASGAPTGSTDTGFHSLPQLNLRLSVSLHCVVVVRR